MSDGSDTLSALVDIAELVVRAVTEEAGEWWVVVETREGPVGCPVCGSPAVGHGRRTVTVRDLPMAGRPMRLMWRKRIWRCDDANCEAVTWSESIAAIAPRAALTERARAEATRRVGCCKHTVAEVARDFGVGWHAVMAAVRRLGQPLVEDAARIRPTPAIGLDEHSFARPAPDRPARWSTVVTDLHRGRLVDLFEGKDAASVRAWLAERDALWCAAVTEVATDGFAGYQTAVVRKGPDGQARLGHAHLVADRFHVIGTVNRHLDRCRMRVQRGQLGRRGQGADPLYRIRRLLLRGAERLSQRQLERLATGLAEGDPGGEVVELWAIKELLRDLYRLKTAGAAAALDAIIEHCRASAVPEARSLVRILTRWRRPILAAVEHQVSNAAAEAVNLGIEELIRTARGFRNYDNYRLRVVLAYGVDWQTPVTARIRTRKPRLVA